MKIGDLIRDLRQNRNLTQQEVAAKIEISRSVLSQYENNLVEPTVYVVKRFATFFEVSADYLLGLEDETGAKAVTTAPMLSGYSTEERKLIDSYRELNTSGKRLVNETIKTLLATSAGSEQKNKIS